jgi:hypothetical protein
MTQMNPRNLSPDELLGQCRWEAFRGPGPGGQKRNKTSSSVRIIHTPTGISATAGEFRSQQRNKSNALLRLRHRMAIELRDPVAETFAPNERVRRCFVAGRLHCSVRDEAYPEVLGILLDLLHAQRGVVSEAAQYLGLTTANLVGFLQCHDEALSAVNRIRKEAGLRPLGGRK